jgi:hypothetical protein
MGIPQVPGRLKRAPTLVLRAVFAGVGRIVLSADRPPAVREGAAAPGGNGELPPQLTTRRQQRPSRAPVAPPGSRWRSLDRTGNVRLLSDEDEDDDYEALSRPGKFGAAPREAGRTSVPRQEPRPGPVTGASAAATVADGPDLILGSSVPRQTLPLANYDHLTLASVRARLRGLDVGQLRILADYERDNAGRPELVGMFERRIEKLQAEE